MKNAWAVRVATDEVLQTSVQLGVNNLVFYGGPGMGVLPGTDQPHGKDRNTYEDYVAFRERVESFGLKIAACEGGFVAAAKYHDVAFGGPGRDKLIDELAAEIADMGRAGIPILGYHWMPASVWRSGNTQVRGAADATAWDSDSDEMAPIQEISIPGHYDLSRENMWECLEYWIRAITPVAEEAGIRLGIHPDDPPVPELGGVPRLLGSFDAYKRLTSIVDSPSNAIEFCQGTFSEMEGEDIYEMIRFFAGRKKVLYVHFRNVSARVPRFNEEFINTGYVDMKRAMETYNAAGYDGVFMDDHCPLITGDTDFPGNWGGYRSRIFAQGYIQAMLEAVTGNRPV
ncbi:MAG: mannonate dehydratase [Dehalococcoidia bacterium]|jgi:mannonate dehydratase|nr:mannonate dehydratase [Dehalococcoidia bacterium]